ncbi:MAG TPA: hypothetical protein VF950_13140 [Planctomycetota bacterium]
MEPTVVGLAEAIDRRRELHRQLVRVRGVLRMDFEGWELRPLDGQLKPPPEAKLWIDLGFVPQSKWKSYRDEFHRYPVEVVATLNADDHGHMSLYPAALRNVKSVTRFKSDA